MINGSTYKVSLQVRYLFLAAPDIALQLRGHLLLLVQLDLGHPDVLLQLV